MLPVELTFLTHKLLELPPVAKSHFAGLALLRDAFTRAGFRVGKEIPSEIQGLTFYLGGFEAFDPGTDGTLRVMSMFCHSTAKAPDSSGISYSWTVTQALEQMRTLQADRRELATRELAAYRLGPVELAAFDAETIVSHFERALSAPGFLATPGQATNFVARLLDALAP